MPMLTIESLIAVLSFGLSCFGLGYIGNKTQKNNRPWSAKLRRLFFQMIFNG